MIVLPEYGHPYIIESVSGPVVPKYSWFYDSGVNDFLLKPIRLLEETTGATVRVRINGFEFDVPASWHLLVVDEETKIVDTIQITQCSSSSCEAFLMHPDESSYVTSPIVLLDLYMKRSCVHVMIPRGSMMLHPVGPVKNERMGTERSYCCLLSPQDVGKHMVNMTAMEVLI
jgi:hypothetical protein